MHQTAVIILCVLIAYFVWRDLVEVFVAWYSGAEPPLTVRTKTWIWSRTAIALAAAAAAVATL